MLGSIPGARTSWTARTITATDADGGGFVGAGLSRPSVGLVVLVFVTLCAVSAAQGVRSHTRLDPRGTKVTQSQAETLTLTLGTADVRLLQTWVRTAGTIDKTGKVLSGTIPSPDSSLVKVGQ